MTASRTKGRRIRDIDGVQLTSVSNNTKWQRLRNWMLGMENPPKFRMKDLNGYYTAPDCEWLYHFSDGGFETMRYVDLIVESDEQSAQVLEKLVQAELPGHAIEKGYRVYGYTLPGEFVEKFQVTT